MNPSLELCIFFCNVLLLIVIFHVSQWPYLTITVAYCGILISEIYSIPTKIFDSKFKVAQVACGFEHVVILMESGCIHTHGSSR